MLKCLKEHRIFLTLTYNYLQPMSRGFRPLYTTIKNTLYYAKKPANFRWNLIRKLTKNSVNLQLTSLQTYRVPLWFTKLGGNCKIKMMKKNKKTIIIRNPKKSEFSKICRLVNQAEKPYQKIMPDYKPFKVENFEIMQKKTKRSFLIIELNKKIAGFAAWKIKNRKICWISILHIDPQKQKMGLGTKLLQEIEKIARKKNCDFCMLELFPQANWAKNFYLKNNYKILPKKDYRKRIFKGILSPTAKTLVMIKK